MFKLLLIIGVVSAVQPSFLAQTAEEGETVVQTAVTPAERLALHLQKIDAKMYGAFWCPACSKQKELFGDRAFRLIKYIECDPRGTGAQPQLCREQQIRAYPTWMIRGKRYEGVRSLAELAELSQFRN